MIMAADYKKLAEIFHRDFKQGKSDDEIAEILKRRLQCHGPELACRIGKTNKDK